MRYARLLPIVVAAAILAFAGNGGTSLAIATITVNSPDGDDDGGCLSPPDGDCTLPDAIGILPFLSNVGQITIKFDPSVFTGPTVIYPLEPLPIIHANLIGGFVLDGTGVDVRIMKHPDHVPNWPGLAIEGDNIHSIEIKNIQVWGFDREGIYICGGLNGGNCNAPLANVTLTNVLTNQNKLTGVTIKGTDVSNVHLNNVQARQNGFGLEGPVSGVLVQGSNSISGLTVDGGLMSENAADGFTSAGGTTSDVSISSLQASLNHLAGILVGAEGASIFDVTVDDVTTAGNLHTGLALAATAALTEISVSDSTFEDNISYGMSAYGGLALGTATISNNQSNRNTSGIYVSSNGEANDVLIEGNATNNNADRGISFGSGGGKGNVIRQNTVSGNSGDGIRLAGTPATSALISRNSTYQNNYLGIDLVGEGDPATHVTLNDPGDADIGVNGLLNFPVLTGGGGVFVTGSVCTGCLLELFLSDNDPIGYGEGKTFISETTGDENGNFGVPICGLGLEVGTVVTATATDPAGNTSEFSPNYAIPVASGDCPGTPTPSPTASATASPTPTSAGPTPTPTPIGHTPTPMPTGGAELTQGDDQCDDDVDAADALTGLQANAALPYNQQPGCPDIGSEIGIVALAQPAGDVALFGDVDCDGDVDAVDALKILQFVAGLPFGQSEPCPDLGTTLE